MLSLAVISVVRPFPKNIDSKERPRYPGRKHRETLFRGGKEVACFRKKRMFSNGRSKTSFLSPRFAVTGQEPLVYTVD